MEIVKKTGYIVAATFITILGLLEIWILAIRININTDGIKRAMKNSSYYDNIETKISEEFSSYIEKERVQEILSNISVEDNINYILSGIEDNTIDSMVKNVKQEMYNVISQALGDKVSEENIELFSKTMSERYVKTLLPISYLTKYAELYVKYVEKVDMIIVILLITTTLLVILLMINRKGFKYGIVALYNTIIIGIYILVVLLSNKRFALGDIRLVIEKVVDGIAMTVGVELIIIMVIIIIANYVRYFKKSNK